MRKVKPAVKAKTVRRGRPIGSKNKPKNPIDDFKKTLDEWDRMEAESSKVDLKNLAEKLQNALAKSYVECEQLEKNIGIYQNEITRRDVIIQYLESKLA